MYDADKMMFQGIRHIDQFISGWVHVNNEQAFIIELSDQVKYQLNDLKTLLLSFPPEFKVMNHHY